MGGHEKFSQQSVQSQQRSGASPASCLRGPHSRRCTKGKDFREEVERKGRGGEKTRKDVCLGNKNEEFLEREFITTLCYRTGRFVFVGLVELTQDVTFISGVQLRDLTSLYIMLCSLQV